MPIPQSQDTTLECKFGQISPLLHYNKTQHGYIAREYNVNLNYVHCYH